MVTSKITIHCTFVLPKSCDLQYYNNTIIGSPTQLVP